MQRTSRLVGLSLILFILMILISLEIISKVSTIVFHPVNDERNLVYRHDSILGWFPIENFSGKYSAATTISVNNNKLGFRDKLHGPKQKQRIAFLGDSFVWGYDVEETDRFSDVLRTNNPSWEIVNLGVSGYGTDQEFILLKAWFDHFNPDQVVLMFYQNDWDENRRNLVHRGYFKPYYTVESDSLVTNGIPVPQSINYYRKKKLGRKNGSFSSTFKLVDYYYSLPSEVEVPDPTIRILEEMKSFTESKNASFLVVFIDSVNGADHCDFCADIGLEYHIVSSDKKYEAGGRHWTPAGHREISAQLRHILKRPGNQRANGHSNS